MANSQDRSKVILINPRAKTEEYRRSNHNDFATAAELKQRNFSGWRVNRVTDTNELWVLGEVVKTVTAEQERLNPLACVEAQLEYFKMIK